MVSSEEVYVKTGDLKPSLRNLNIIVKTVSVGEPRLWTSRRGGPERKVAEALVGDETGSVLLTLWDDQINFVEENAVYEIRNGYTSLFKGSLRLSIGRYGTIKSSEKTIEEVNTKNNLSEVRYQPSYWSSPLRRPFRRSRRR